ncbi:uncharacterized protein B0T15DRAFT_164150 [Chaetomium strumarium]|uniref:Uncharacterized protein n=1 Tax=Chaetomium strumarium TaxID=1170767 RepID=A0AAJ0M310_9PEZI|nr:hypothetical protein B0T15DRAFT_164150 [Chaetomium strumarium]
MSLGHKQEANCQSPSEAYVHSNCSRNRQGDPMFAFAPSNGSVAMTLPESCDAHTPTRRLCSRLPDPARSLGPAEAETSCAAESRLSDRSKAARDHAVAGLSKATSRRRRRRRSFTRSSLISWLLWESGLWSTDSYLPCRVHTKGRNSLRQKMPPACRVCGSEVRCWHGKNGQGWYVQYTSRSWAVVACPTISLCSASQMQPDGDAYPNMGLRPSGSRLICLLYFS